MELLFTYNQEKKERKGNSSSKCDLKLYLNDKSIAYIGLFNLEYCRLGNKRDIIFEHSFEVDLYGGDIMMIYKITNNGLVNEKMFETTTVVKKNDFKFLDNLLNQGFEKGEKRHGFWGVNYERSIKEIENKIFEIILKNFESEYHKKSYLSLSSEKSLYKLLIDHHLDKKNIKGHNNIYYDIQNDYPKKKWLERNENKFLPAVLDSYNIKSKYFISELNKKNEHINIPTLNYLCKLFGQNYIEYVKKINWKSICFETIENKRIHELKNEHEKNCLVKILNIWTEDINRLDLPIKSINELLTLRVFLEKNGIQKKFILKNVDEFDTLLEEWKSEKTYLTRGYKIKYEFPDYFIDEIEQDIIIDNKIFKPKILKSEDDYRFEAVLMKNCLANQFKNGLIYIYVSLRDNKKRINLQYRKGILNQSLAKANTKVPDYFQPAIEILNSRFQYNSDVVWKKIKFDFIHIK